MKPTQIFVLICLLLSLHGKAQVNLVPNSSFEDTLGCFISMIVSSPVTFNNYLKDWYTTSYTSPDYFNTCANTCNQSIYPYKNTVPANCFGYQSPRTGNAYVGLANYDIKVTSDTVNMYVEYISVKLKQQLKANTCYYGEFYASLSNDAGYAINQLSMLLTANQFTTAVYSFTNTLKPQIQWDTTKYFTDTLNWVKIGGYFTAQGGEEHLTIGNFKNGLYTKKIKITPAAQSICQAPVSDKGSYVFIDDVSLYEVSKPNLGDDVFLCGKMDSVVIGDTTLNTALNPVKWYANGLYQSGLNASTISVKPTQNTTYVLEYGNCSADTIVVKYSLKCPQLSDSVLIIPNVFTPNDDGANDVWRFVLPNGCNLKSIQVFNRWGNLIYQKTNKLSQTTVLWDGRTTSGELCQAGVYYFILSYIDANGDEHKRNGYLSLIR